MDFQAFLTAVFEFVKKLLSYLGEWPFPETEEDAAPEETPAE